MSDETANEAKEAWIQFVEGFGWPEELPWGDVDDLVHGSTFVDLRVFYDVVIPLSEMDRNVPVLSLEPERALRRILGARLPLSTFVDEPTGSLREFARRFLPRDEVVWFDGYLISTPVDSFPPQRPPVGDSIFVEEALYLDPRIFLEDILPLLAAQSLALEPERPLRRVFESSSRPSTGPDFLALSMLTTRGSERLSLEHAIPIHNPSLGYFSHLNHFLWPRGRDQMMPPPRHPLRRAIVVFDS